LGNIEASSTGRDVVSSYTNKQPFHYLVFEPILKGINILINSFFPTLYVENIPIQPKEDETIEQQQERTYQEQLLGIQQYIKNQTFNTEKHEQRLLAQYLQGRYRGIASPFIYPFQKGKYEKPLFEFFIEEYLGRNSRDKHSEEIFSRIATIKNLLQEEEVFKLYRVFEGQYSQLDSLNQHLHKISNAMIRIIDNDIESIEGLSRKKNNDAKIFCDIAKRYTNPIAQKNLEERKRRFPRKNLWDDLDSEFKENVTAKKKLLKLLKKLKELLSSQEPRENSIFSLDIQGYIKPQNIGGAYHLCFSPNERPWQETRRYILTKVQELHLHLHGVKISKDALWFPKGKRPIRSLRMIGPAKEHALKKLGTKHKIALLKLHKKWNQLGSYGARSGGNGYDCDLDSLHIDWSEENGKKIVIGDGLRGHGTGPLLEIILNEDKSYTIIFDGKVLEKPSKKELEKYKKEKRRYKQKYLKDEALEKPYNSYLELKKIADDYFTEKNGKPCLAQVLVRPELTNISRTDIQFFSQLNNYLQLPNPFKDWKNFPFDEFYKTLEIQSIAVINERGGYIRYKGKIIKRCPETEFALVDNEVMFFRYSDLESILLKFLTLYLITPVAQMDQEGSIEYEAALHHGHHGKLKGPNGEEIGSDLYEEELAKLIEKYKHSVEQLNAYEEWIRAQLIPHAKELFTRVIPEDTKNIFCCTHLGENKYSISYNTNKFLYNAQTQTLTISSSNNSREIRGIRIPFLTKLVRGTSQFGKNENFFIAREHAYFRQVESNVSPYIQNSEILEEKKNFIVTKNTSNDFLIEYDGWNFKYNNQERTVIVSHSNNPEETKTIVVQKNFSPPLIKKLNTGESITIKDSNHWQEAFSFYQGVLENGDDTLYEGLIAIFTSLMTLLVAFTLSNPEDSKNALPYGEWILGGVSSLGFLQGFLLATRDRLKHIDILTLKKKNKKEGNKRKKQKDAIDQQKESPIENDPNFRIERYGRVCMIYVDNHNITINNGVISIHINNLQVASHTIENEGHPLIAAVERGESSFENINNSRRKEIYRLAQKLLQENHKNQHSANPISEVQRTLPVKNSIHFMGDDEEIDTIKIQRINNTLTYLEFGNFSGKINGETNTIYFYYQSDENSPKIYLGMQNANFSEALERYKVGNINTHTQEDNTNIFYSLYNPLAIGLNNIWGRKNNLGYDIKPAKELSVIKRTAKINNKLIGVGKVAIENKIKDILKEISQTNPSPEIFYEVLLDQIAEQTNTYFPSIHHFYEFLIEKDIALYIQLTPQISCRCFTINRTESEAFLNDNTSINISSNFLKSLSNGKTISKVIDTIRGTQVRVYTYETDDLGMPVKSFTDSYNLPKTIFIHRLNVNSTANEKTNFLIQKEYEKAHLLFQKIFKTLLEEKMKDGIQLEKEFYYQGGKYTTKDINEAFAILYSTNQLASSKREKFISEEKSKGLPGVSLALKILQNKEDISAILIILDNYFENKEDRFIVHQEQTIIPAQPEISALPTALKYSPYLGDIENIKIKKTGPVRIFSIGNYKININTGSHTIRVFFEKEGKRIQIKEENIPFDNSLITLPLDFPRNNEITINKALVSENKENSRFIMIYNIIGNILENIATSRTNGLPEIKRSTRLRVLPQKSNISTINIEITQEAYLSKRYQIQIGDFTFYFHQNNNSSITVERNENNIGKFSNPILIQSIKTQVSHQFSSSDEYFDKLYNELNEGLQQCSKNTMVA
jgi:hypothetical protein